MTGTEGRECCGDNDKIDRAATALNRTRMIELALVAVTCIAALLALGFTVVNSNQTREISESNRQILERRAGAEDFGLSAIRCVLDQFALHRITNQEVHDHMAGVLHVDATPLSPLPPLPTDTQVRADCEPFYRR